MDEEILTCVQSIFGDNVKIVDCEKNASVLEEELVHINGIPVKLNSLDGDDAHAIKIALLEGETPSIEILNKLLEEAGILQKPMQLETTTSIKSSLTTKQEVNISKHGQLLEARTTQTKEDSVRKSSEKVIWQPPRPIDKSLKSAHKHQLTDNCQNSSSTLTTSTTTTSATSGTASTTASNSDNGSQSVIDMGGELYVVEPTCSYTSGQGLWHSNSMASAGCADDNISHLTANLSLDSGFPATDFKQSTATTEQLVVYEDGALVSGTIEALVALLTPRHNYYPDTAFSYTFLLSARLFVSPADLFEQVAQTWQSRHNLLDSDAATCRTKSVHNLLRLLNLWLDNFPSDFRLAKLKEKILQLLNNLPNMDFKSKFQKSLETAIKPNVVQVTTEEVEKYEKPDERIMRFKDLCDDSLILSQQLLLLELQYFSSLSAEELLLENAINVKKYRKYSQQLTLLVAQHILQFTKKKQRITIVEYWLETAQLCFNNGNFNSMCAIINALKLPAIARLKKMWLKIDNSKINTLEQQLDAEGNYANYHASLKAAISHSQNGATDYVIIPIFHIFLADLQVLASDFKTWLPNGHIDYGKCLKLSEFVQQMFEKSRGLKAKFEAISEVISLLNQLTYATKCQDNTLMLWSFACESPYSADEKKLLKALKSKKKNIN